LRSGVVIHKSELSSAGSVGEHGNAIAIARSTVVERNGSLRFSNIAVHLDRASQP
jgi:hypothetical protein